MKENHQFLTGLILGALAGSALVVYFNSDKGKQLLEDLTGKAASFTEAFKEDITNADESLQQMLAKAKQVVTDIEQRLNQV
jgi:gas vesicle protein